MLLLNQYLYVSVSLIIWQSVSVYVILMITFTISYKTCFSSLCGILLDL